MQDLRIIITNGLILAAPLSQTIPVQIMPVVCFDLVQGEEVSHSQFGFSDYHLNKWLYESELGSKTWDEVVLCIRREIEGLELDRLRKTLASATSLKDFTATVLAANLVEVERKMVRVQLLVQRMKDYVAAQSIGQP